MSEFIKGFIKKNKPQFLKYKKYIVNNDWSSIQIDENLSDENFIDYIDKEHTNKKIIKSEMSKFVKEKLASQKSNLKYKGDEFQLQQDITKEILNRLKFFVKKAEGDHHLSEFKSFIKECLSIIKIHTDRVDFYVESVDISQIENQDIRSDEMKFLKECFADISRIDDNIAALNIKDDTQDTSGIVFHDNVKAPLCMHEQLVKLYPEIERKISAMKIDFDSPPKNEMLIYMDKSKVPVWNVDKHYFEQEKNTLQFYVDEFKKIKNGINIDGQPIEPWLYFHINHFVTEIPRATMNNVTGQLDIKKDVIIPPLRDNEWYIIQDNYRDAKIKGRMLFIAATRRLFKSTGLASHLHHIAITGGKELVVGGGSAKDLGQLEKNVKVSMQNCNPAFAPNNLTNDWSKKVQLGIKTKGGKNLLQAVIHIINLNSGGEKSSEVLAGFTPDAFVIDEIMKAPFIDQLNGAKPSFDTPAGKLCTPILSGTGGNVELSRDALIFLNDPEDYDVLPMNWEALERGIAKEDIPWKRRKFGTFAPAAMSAKEGMVKIESNLADYLGRPDSAELRKIKILLTDWKRCNEIIKADRLKLAKNKQSLTKEIVYYPNDPEEIFLSGKVNPFNREVAERHLRRIREEGLTGRKVDLFKGRDSKYTQIELSKKELPKFPHKGGFHDSPVVIFGEFPTVKPPRGLFVASLDDYKQEEADSDSVGCFKIFKRQSGNDEWGDRIAATYASRPNPHSKFHNIGYMLLEAYNAECLMENEDMEFKTYLDTLHKTDQYLVPSFNMAGDLTLKVNNRRTYGISPSGNKSAILNKAINYANKVHTLKDENDKEYTIYGIELINDELLLEEMINYKEGENHDRITTFGIALIQAHYLDANYVEARIKEPEKKEMTMSSPKSKLFTTTRRRLF